ncbi:hypothetical protein Zmor_011663 [Zophobas morio]|uniref:Uncharacterized protein n=1 Tax=Zophobas morio TaxID=2755281 RepID=A0AA38MJN4_9CUCU|nr:hypothetical protein Zmor_011663 [Zophobas morio]
MAIKCRKCDMYIHRNENYINCREKCGDNYHLKIALISICLLMEPKHGIGPTANKTVLNETVLIKFPDSLKNVFADFARTVCDNFVVISQQITDLTHENYCDRINRLSI